MVERKTTYIRVDSPDKERLSDLVVRAIGPSRNQTEFAKVLGVNPSTLSRIINKKNSGASSDDLILSIADHADPGSGVTEEMLMRAHGMVPDRDERGRIMYSRQLNEEYSENVIKQISTEILDRGYSVNRMMREVRYPVVQGTASLRADIVVETNAVEGGNHLWAFDCLLPRMFQGYSAAGRISEPTIHDKMRFAGRNIFDRIGRILALEYAGIVHKEDIPEKFSLVIADREAYAYVIERYKDFSFPRQFSFILLDLEYGYIVEEFNCKRADGFVGKNFFTPINRRTSDCEDDEEFFSFDDDNE